MNDMTPIATPEPAIARTPAALANRVAEVTNVSIGEMAAEGYHPAAVDARMTYVWVANRIMRDRYWSWKDIGCQINRHSEATRRISRSSNGKRMNDPDWLATARMLLAEFAKPRVKGATRTARSGKKVTLTPQRQLTLPYRGPSVREQRDAARKLRQQLREARERMPVSPNSKDASAINYEGENWGFAGYQGGSQYRHMINQNEAFERKMLELGYAKYVVGPNGERKHLEPRAAAVLV